MIVKRLTPNRSIIEGGASWWRAPSSSSKCVLWKYPYARGGGGGGPGEDIRSRYCSSSASSSLVDLSAYLLAGCNWKHAPTCPDYVGPLSIKRTRDGRGRGLYASQNVPAGDILLISNPFAVSYNDHSSIQLYRMIASIVKQSSRALHLFYSLAGYDDHDDMPAPPIQLFDPNAPFPHGGAVLQNPEFDARRVMDIMNTNCFAGELRTPCTEPVTKLSGLWLVPSFINHSCNPNASRLLVGKAMLILASQDIAENEEVTIAYTDCLSPVNMREEALETLGCGFRCECKRCIVERSLQEQLQEISDPFEAFYDKAVDEVYSVLSKQGSPSLYACRELSKLFDILSNKLTFLENVSALEKQWILAGYSFGFLGNCFAEYLSGRPQTSLSVSNVAFDLVESMKCTAPGMLRTLSFIMILATRAKQQHLDSDLVERLYDLAMDECVRVHGKQRLDVTLKLMEQSLDAIPFV